MPNPTNLPDRTPPSAQRFNRQRVEKTCVACGTPFTVQKIFAAAYATCSTACSSTHRRALKAHLVKWPMSVVCGTCRDTFRMTAAVGRLHALTHALATCNHSLDT